MKKTKEDLDFLDKHNITYYSINVECKKDEDGNWLHKKDYPDQLIKWTNKFPTYKNKKLKTYYSDERNSSMILLGDRYNLIGIDIDPKEDTLDRYKQICIDNNYDNNTLTVSTMHGGLHEYYRLNEKQRGILSNFCSMDGVIYGLHIDVKYNNQFFYGPSIITADKIYKYTIIKHIEPIILPEFLFSEIEKNIKMKISTNRNKNIVEKNKKSAILNDLTNDKKFNNYNSANEKLEPYLNCLDGSKIKYRKWVKIGFIIYNEGGSCELFDKYSQKWRNYDNTCYEKWKTFGDESLKKVYIGSLIRMAKNHNFVEYRKIYLKNKYAVFNDLFFDEISSLQLAYIFYNRVSNGYIYDAENDVWYSINKYGIYSTDHKNLKLTDNFNMLVPYQIEKYYKKLLHKYALTDNLDKEQIKKYTECINLINSNYLKIKRFIIKNCNKREIVNDLKLLYFQPKIYEKMDNINNYVFGFNNGVYDITNREFRNAYPEELVSCTSGYDYALPCPDATKKLELFLESVFPDVDELSYLLKTLSFGLIGDIPREEFYIYIGSGSNGKGCIGSLLKYTLGDYFDSTEIEYFIKTAHQNSATSADPVMARKKNCRIVITTEPENDVCLRTAKLKQLSGRDPVQVRELYKSPFNFVPKFKLIIQTNENVDINGNDGGIIRRLRFIVFPNKFVDFPTQPNHRPVDRDLKSKFEKIEFRVAFFHILLKYYYLYIDIDKGNLVIPSRISKDTSQFLYDNDPFQLFIDTKICITNNQSDIVKTTDLHQAFDDFHKHKIKISPSNFKKGLIDKSLKWKEIKKSGFGSVFCGITLIDDCDDNHIHDLDA